MMKKYYLKLTSIEKNDFSFYGCECDYYMDVYNTKKVKVGEAMVPVVQQGIDYSSAYEFIYDYDLTDEEQRQELADQLHVESILDEWLDEDGDIDTSKLPERVCQDIADAEDEMLMDWYYEDFGESADEDGFMPLETFAEKYEVGEDGTKITKLDLDLPLSEMFSEVSWRGSYKPIEISSSMLRQTVDITQEGKDIFLRVACILAAEMDDLDTASGMVNIRFDGDYDREAEAKELCDDLYVVMAYIIVQVFIPLAKTMDEEDWKQRVARMINAVGKAEGYVYDDTPNSEFDDVASTLYDRLLGKERRKGVQSSYKTNFTKIIENNLERGYYPKSDKIFQQLLKCCEVI